MTYTREELDWMEAEWAFHLHGRQAFMSREDFLQIQVWEGEGVPADAVVGAMDAYFQRRAKRGHPRTWVALAHLAKDVAKAAQLRVALAKAEAPTGEVSGWETVKEPLRSEPRAKAAFEAWKRFQAKAPAPDAPGFLDHYDEERRLFRDLMALAESRLAGEAESLKAGLVTRLAEAKLMEGTLVWKRAWDHHWNRTICEAWRIP